MQTLLGRNVYWQSFLVLVLSCLMLVACDIVEEDTSLPAGCDGVTWGSDIQVEERDEDYYAIIQGDFPDSCSTICGSEQTVDENTINIDLSSSRPEDAVCSQMLTPFATEVPLDTAGLNRGENTVTLYETHATTTFTLE